MSKLQDLIDRLCPNGVEFKPLGEIASLSRGKVYSKEYLRDNPGIYPVYSSQTANDGVLGKINSFDYEGEFLTWTTDGAYAGTIFHRKGRFNITNVCGLITLKSFDVNIRYLYYWLSIEAPKHVYAGMGNPKLMSNQASAIPIPLPPLEVQEEIVRILDRFADYAAELQAELQARKEQYEYYRNLLLTFNPSAYGSGTDDEQKDSITRWGGHSYKIQWKKMGEIGTFIRGNGLQKKDFTESGVGCIHYGQIYTHYGTFADETKSFVSEELAKSLLKVESGDIVLACTSENIEDVAKAVAWLGKDTIVTGGHSVVFKHKENPKYIAYFFQTALFFNQKKKYAYGAKVIDIKTDDLAKIEIPVPPKELQEKIAAILDRFETLVNDLSKGLPAEIAAVKAQYEYYRNKLLTFKDVAG